MSEERARIALVGLFAAVTLAAGVLIGRATKPAHHGAPAAVVVAGGVAVGVLDTPAGALAAADNYLASSSQTVEQDRPSSPHSLAPSTPRVAGEHTGAGGAGARGGHHDMRTTRRVAGRSRS